VINAHSKNRSIGSTVQRLRKHAGMTLNDLAKQAGISVSAVSKIENGLSSPTFDTIIRLALGLNVDISELFGCEVVGTVSGRRAITRKGEGVEQATPHYDYEMLCSSLATKAFTPLLTKIRARSVEEFHELHKHSGEEFFFVLSGRVILHSELYAPVELKEGDSTYFDSGMGHALVSVGPEDARVLWIATRVYGVLDMSNTEHGSNADT